MTMKSRKTFEKIRFLDNSTHTFLFKPRTPHEKQNDAEDYKEANNILYCGFTSNSPPAPY